MVSEAAQDIAAKLIGAWRYVGANVNGQRRNLGADPKGMIYYGPHGEMMVQIAPDVERRRAGNAPTAEEAKHAIAGYIAYLGTYSIDVQVPGMLYGAVVHSPVEGAEPETFDEAKVRAIAGVVKRSSCPMASVLSQRRRGRRSQGGASLPTA